MSSENVSTSLNWNNMGNSAVHAGTENVRTLGDSIQFHVPPMAARRRSTTGSHGEARLSQQPSARTQLPPPESGPTNVSNSTSSSTPSIPLSPDRTVMVTRTVSAAADPANNEPPSASAAANLPKA